jgi:hypothetical protein
MEPTGGLQQKVVFTTVKKPAKIGLEIRKKLFLYNSIGQTLTGCNIQ